MYVLLILKIPQNVFLAALSVRYKYAYIFRASHSCSRPQLRCVWLSTLSLDTYKTQRSAIFRIFNPNSTSRFAISQTTRYKTQNRLFFQKYMRYKTRVMCQDMNKFGDNPVALGQLLTPHNTTQHTAGQRTWLLLLL